MQPNQTLFVEISFCINHVFYRKTSKPENDGGHLEVGGWVGPAEFTPLISDGTLGGTVLLSL